MFKTGDAEKKKTRNMMMIVLQGHKKKDVFTSNVRYVHTRDRPTDGHEESIG